MEKKTLSIIGFGSFTKLMIKHLSPYFNILVSSRKEVVDKDGLDFQVVDLEEALKQKIIILSMPSQFLDDFLAKNTKFIQAGSLVVDVCSVKIAPVKAMLQNLNKDVQILATHPLFGPTSAKNGLDGHKIMVHPVRIDEQKFLKIKNFLEEQLKLEVIETTPEAHDQQIAYSLGLSHYIGRIMQNMSIPDLELTTNAYDDLLDMKNIQGNDTWDLFRSIESDNPYTKDVINNFKQAMTELDEQIKQD